MNSGKLIRHLPVRVQRPRAINSRFAWLVGIALAVLFLACVAMAYRAHRAQAHRAFLKRYPSSPSCAAHRPWGRFATAVVL